MPPDNGSAVSKTSEVDRDQPDGHRLGGDRFSSQRTQGTYQHPQIRSLIAKHCQELSSGLVDIFRTEVEREVNQRVSGVITSEATAYHEHLRSRDEALSAAEARCSDLQEQLDLSNQMCHQLQERVKQLEATEAELRIALNEGLEIVGSSRPSGHGLHSPASLAAAAADRGHPTPTGQQTSRGRL